MKYIQGGGELTIDLLEKIKDNIVEGIIGIITGIVIIVFIPMFIFALSNSKEAEEIVEIGTSIYEEVEKQTSFAENVCDGILEYINYEIDAMFEPL